MGEMVESLGRRSRRRYRELLWRFPRLIGPFGFQDNNETRLFEYPWAFHAAPISKGMTVVDLGGSLSGFQFVLDKAGARVVNVDPGEAASGVGWPVTEGAIRHLNAAFGTSVRLHPSVLQDAPIAAGTVDRIYTISTLEHIPPEEIESTVVAAHRLLRPGGLFILTVDLFINLEPFCSRIDNEFGTNLDIKQLVDRSGMELVAGDPSELLGFPQFDPDNILSKLDEFLLGGYPAVAQAFALRKEGCG